MSTLLEFITPSREVGLNIFAYDSKKPTKCNANVLDSVQTEQHNSTIVEQFVLIGQVSPVLAIQRTILKNVSALMNSDEHFTIHALIPLITQEMGISLRALDWLVTNYSKKHQLCINYQNIHSGYKEMLSRYRRRHFDPFQRCIDAPSVGKVTFMFGERKYETTIGQLNFIMWCYKRGIIDYIKKYINTIETDMNSCLNSRRAQSIIKEKRMELSRAPRHKCAITAL